MYELSRRLIFMEAVTERLTTEYKVFNEAVASLMEAARRDLAGEGLPVEKAVFGLELDMLYGGQVNVKRMSSPRLLIHSPEDVQAIYDAFEREFSEAFSPLVVNRPGGVYLDNFVLKVTVPTEKLEIPEFPLEKPDPSSAHTGKRPVYWADCGDYIDTPLFAYTALRPGHCVEGPAVIEADLTTIVIPPGQRFSVDCFGLGIIEDADVKAAASTKDMTTATQRQTGAEKESEQ